MITALVLLLLQCHTFHKHYSLLPCVCLNTNNYCYRLLLWLDVKKDLSVIILCYYFDLKVYITVDPCPKRRQIPFQSVL